MIIAVDGPTASGKGTIAKALAAHFGLPHLDTGLLYRAVGWHCAALGGDPDNEADALRGCDFPDALLDNPALRLETTGSLASRASVHPAVRAALLARQRAFADQPGGAVLDGRDIGTVIAPHADVKLFITASAEERARRRHADMLAHGSDVGFDAILADIRARDDRDSARATAPLVAAADAIVIDTSRLDRDAAISAAIAAADAALSSAPKLRLRDYDDSLAPLFHDINAEWIQAMFTLEPTDRDILENPQERIIAPGGTIMFVEAAGLGIVGTCALLKTGPAAFELTKMGVRETARGLKAGEFLLAAMISRAAEMGAEKLYLLTNHKCAAAIHLYEKLGFEHDAEIMADYGARYQRCDVAMRYRLPSTT